MLLHLLRQIKLRWFPGRSIKTQPETEIPRSQYIVRGYPNTDLETIDTINCIRKIAYHNGDTIWMKDGEVIGVKPHDHAFIIKYIDDKQFFANTILIDQLTLPKLNHRQRNYIIKGKRR